MFYNNWATSRALFGREIWSTRVSAVDHEMNLFIEWEVKKTYRREVCRRLR